MFLALGFRPFYLFAALFAVVSIPLWIVSFSGIWHWTGYLQGMNWHSHEMLFGFAVAVMSGFLLTAVRNWTGLPTPSGAALAALAGLWVLGRILIWTGPEQLSAFVDVAFLPVLGITLALPVLKSGNQRNLKILLILMMLFLANCAYHLASLGKIESLYMHLAITVTLDLFTILMAIVGGRVIPAFTANAVKSARPRRSLVVEVSAFGALLLILIGHLLKPAFALPDTLWLILFIFAAGAHIIRLALWEPFKTLTNPLLLMLPMAYAWIPLSFAVRAFSMLSKSPQAAADHALAVGAIGGLMLAMMMRSALGHTGRDLVAGKIEIFAFAAIQIAAIVRVTAALAIPGVYREALVTAAFFWSLAFLIFLLKYGSVLTQPRIDGRVG